MRRTLLRLWPLGLIAAALAAAYALGLQHALSFEALGQRQQQLQAVVAAHPAWSALGFVAAYVAVVALSLPGSLVMTLAGGLLFGPVVGTACAVVGATIGAILLFLAARHALADTLARRAGPMMQRVRAGLEKDGFNYLLAIRLLPIVPFWLANLAPALTGMRLLPFAAATFLGIIPGTAVFSSVGAGLGAVLSTGQQPGLSTILQPRVILPLAALAALSLAPIVVRRFRKAPA